MRPIINPNRDFWNQLLIFEANCRQQQKDTSGNVLFNNLPSISTSITIDAEWCKISNAIYSTCYDILEESSSSMLDQIDPLQKLDAMLLSKETNELNHTLFLLLDYVWD